MHTVKISVRNLVEFILRSGDITTSESGLADPDAMQEGTRIHKKLQKRMGSAYRAEVPLSITLPVTYDSVSVEMTVEGRADGIFPEKNGSGTTIDEIKGIYRHVSRLTGPVPVHKAQAMCYGYIYALENKLKDVGIQMTYCYIPTEEVRTFSERIPFAELEKWFMDLLHEYAKWAVWQIKWQERRNESIQELDFPFEYREGQQRLVKGVYQSILRRKRLYIEAPTGVGKTISTVFPAVKSIGEGVTEKIFYLTAKTITRTVAEETFSLLSDRGMQLKFITLTAKEKICLLDKPQCNPQTCPRALGHFDRINDAVYDILTHEDAISRERILAYAEKHDVCPFEMSLDISTWCDAIIGDYNYAFDPTACLKRFFALETENDYVFLIDEAHNLVERGREMYSASLCKERFLEIRRLLKSKSRKISRTLEKCNRVLLEWKRECEDYQIRKNISELILPLMNLCGELEDFLEEEADGEVHEKLLEFYFEVSKFLNIYDLVDDHYVIYTYYAPNESFLVRLYCVDTSANIQKCLDKANAAVFFSATLLPVQYYISLLSEAKDDYAIYARSPFDPKNRAVLIGTDVSSRYTRRGQEEYMRIAAYIKQTVMQKKGNYLAFFPSYRMLQDVMACTGPQLDTSIRCICQTSGMTEEEREAFLHEFEQKRKEDEGLLGFCVMGGIFGEGIDLKEDSLIGAIIVGTGIPQICREREILKQYYDGRNEDGFAYAYRYPGMNKVLQSAGRVIRTAQDRGVVLLLDERFAKSEYRKMFPREWEECEYCSRSNVADKLGRFWELSEYEH